MVLSRVELFQGLADAELDALASTCVQRHYPRNSVIINERDPADSLFIINSGRVKIYCSDRNGKEYVVNTLGPGEYFGELALLDDDCRSASVRTLEKCNFLVIYKDAFSQVLGSHPGLALALVRNLARRVRRLTGDVKSLALQNVYGRLVKLLVGLAEPRGGDAIVSERLTQQDIADRIGASREMVARILRDLSVGDYIRWEDRRIVLHGRLPKRY